MGYYTTYTLEWTPQVSPEVPCPHCGGTGKLTVADVVADRIKKPTLANGQWSIQQNLEEAGDVWVKYFKNGKMQISKAQIKLEKFDPSKLA